MLHGVEIVGFGAIKAREITPIYGGRIHRFIIQLARDKLSGRRLKQRVGAKMKNGGKVFK